MDLSWFKVDIYLLTVETRLGGSTNKDPCLLDSLDEKPKQTCFGEASWFKSLDCVSVQDDEFSFDFSNTILTAGSIGLPILTLKDIPFVHFPKHTVSRLFVEFRRLARESRAYKHTLQQLEEKRLLEREEQKRKQQQELQQKQKDLVQLALKRAQNAQVKKVMSPPPPQPPVKNNLWSSTLASPVVPAPQGTPQWSSRPVVPPAMNQWSSAPAGGLMIPTGSMSVPTLSLQAAVMQADPWSSANIRTEPPQPKRVKLPNAQTESEEPSDDQRQRMARLGVPFRTDQK